MATTMEQFKAMRDELNKKIEEEGRAALQASFSAFFTDHPEVHALKWTQYTPYFNDGDACTFRLHAAKYLPAASAQTWADDDEGWVRSEDFLYASTWGDDVAPAARAVSEFWKAIEDDGVFETVFGDHVAVLATREGFVVAEYSHD